MTKNAFNKTIDPADYLETDTYQHIDGMTGILSGAFTTWGTEFRKWEYGTVLEALRQNYAKTVLEVGGGSSIFAASAMWIDMDVTVVDPDDYAEMFQQQSQRIGKPISFIRQDFMDYPVNDSTQFDAVTCISVIEHVPDYVPFFYKLMRHVKSGGLLGLTTDFSLDGKAPIYPTHLRTFTAETWMELVHMAEVNGFEVYGDQPDYQTFVPHIYGLYSFCSMVLKKL